MSSPSGVATPLVGAVVLLTLVATGASFALPYLAGQAAGSPFVDVETAEVVPVGAPSTLSVIEADPTIPPDDADPDPGPDDQEEAAEEELVEEEPTGVDDLSDIPEYPVPAGFEVLDGWLDGENLIRVTIYAAAEADEAALVAYLGADRGGWTAVDLSGNEEIDPDTQWLFEHPEHPYCLWIEFYDKGRERRRLERATGLVGPQFLVAESPWCIAEPDGYA